jgi:hypothetical protein
MADMKLVIDGSGIVQRIALGVFALLMAGLAVYAVSQDAIWWPRRGSGGSNWIERTSAPGYFWVGVSAHGFCAFAFAWVALRDGGPTRPGLDEEKAWELRRDFIGSAMFAMVFTAIVVVCLVTGRAGMPGVATATWSENPIKFTLLVGLFGVLGLAFASVALSSSRELRST